jgi:hypothetical protein
MADVHFSVRSWLRATNALLPLLLSVDGDGPLSQRSIQRLFRLGAFTCAGESSQTPGLSIAAGRLTPTVQQAASHEVLFCSLQRAGLRRTAQSDHASEPFRCGA